MACRKSAAPWPSNPADALCAHLTISTAQAERLAARLSRVAPANFAGVAASTSLPAAPKRQERRFSLVRQYTSRPGQKNRYRVALATPELSRSTLRMAVQRQCRASRAVRTADRDWGHIRAVLLLSLSVRKNVSAVRTRLRRRLQNSFGWKARKRCRCFHFEPVVGATLGAWPFRRWIRVTDRRNLPQERHSADRRRNMTGMGRTGKPFAVQPLGIEPDLILVGKGVASGYAPLGAVLVFARVAQRSNAARALSCTGFTSRRIRFALLRNAVWIISNRKTF